MASSKPGLSGSGPSRATPSISEGPPQPRPTFSPCPARSGQTRPPSTTRPSGLKGLCRGGRAPAVPGLANATNPPGPGGRPTTGRRCRCRGTCPAGWLRPQWGRPEQVERRVISLEGRQGPELGPLNCRPRPPAQLRTGPGPRLPGSSGTQERRSRLTAAARPTSRGPPAPDDDSSAAATNSAWRHRLYDELGRLRSPPSHFVVGSAGSVLTRRTMSSSR